MFGEITFIHKKNKIEVRGEISMQERNKLDYITTNCMEDYDGN